MSRRARQISNLVIDEVSLVDKGANEHAVVTIAKNADGENKENEMDIFDELGNPLDVAGLEEGDIVYDAEDNAYSMESEDDGEYEDDEVEQEDEELEPVGKARFGAARQAGRAFGAASGSQARRTAQSFGAGSTGRRYGQMNPGRVRRNRAVAGGAAGGAALGGGGAVAYNRVKKSFDYADEIREELSKALSDADREEIITKALGQVGSLYEEVEIAKAAAEEERQLRVEREYVEIAKSYNLPFEDEALGRMLMHAAEALPIEDQEIIHKAFETAGAAIYEEFGAMGGGDNQDVYAQVEAAAYDQVSKSNGDFSSDEVIAQFFAENPEAYDEYLSERR